MNWVIKLITTVFRRKVLDIVLALFKWYSEQTDAEWDDAVYQKLKQLYDLLYPFIPANRR